MSISLKVGEIDPPSIIMDIVNLPDPVYVGFTIVAYNYDDIGLYFQITGSGTGWTFGTVNLGLIGSGASLRQNLDNFANRARPASETSEQIQLILRAYTDAGYSNLRWTYTKTVDVWFIASNDGSWTQDVLNNFDDGTVQGWAVANELNNDPTHPTINVVTDYVLSTPYSVRMDQHPASATDQYVRGRFYKAFTTPDRANVFAIFDLRAYYGTYRWAKYLNVQTDTTIILWLGRETTTAANEIGVNKWVRIIVPLPRNTSLTIRIVFEWRQVGAGLPQTSYLWMDDFRIISRA